MSWFFVTLGLLLLSPISALAEAPPAQWVVVTAPAFRKAVEPLCEHRKAQGLKVVVVQTTDVLDVKEVRIGQADKLRDHVTRLCRDYEGTSYVLLVGAVEAGKLPDADTKVLPPLTGTISRMKGQPTDNGYGCLDDSRLPSVAVGRLPARTEDEAKAMVQKTIALENDKKPGDWRRRLTILAGIPAYNPLVDRLVEGLALARFDRIDGSWTGRAIYHNPQSRFCVPDAQLQQQALKYVQGGQAFTLYLGHSNAEGLYGGKAHYLDRDDWARLKIGRGSGVFVTFGCNGAQLRGEDGEGYGVAAIRNPDGPAAVTGSHGICFAAMVQLAADGLFESTFTGHPPERLGDCWLAIKKGVADGKMDDVTFGMLDAVDGDAKIPQATQRQEHLEMFLLLGDPALKLPLIRTDIELKLTGEAKPGETLTVAGKAPERLAGAKVRVVLERPVSSTPPDVEPLPKDAAERDKVMLANHERSNRFALATAETEVRDGRFEVKLDLPTKLPYSRVTLRVYAATDRAEGMGVQTLAVRKAEN
jgi:hypothetical protein